MTVVSPPRDRWTDRASAACALLAVTTTATTFLPWVDTGARTRTSYDVVTVAERLGVIDPPWAGLSALWYFVPVLCGVVLVAVAVRWNRVGQVAATTLGAIVTAGAVLVVQSPLITGTEVLGAVIGGGCTFLAGAAALVVTTVRRNR